MQWAPVLALYGLGHLTGLVLDCGETGSRAVSSPRLGVGGRTDCWETWLHDSADSA